MQNWLMPELLKRVSGMRILLTYPKLTLDRRLCWVRITRIGAVEVACEFPILFEDFSVVFSHDLLHAVRIIIGPIRSVAWAHDQGKTQRNMFTAFPLIRTAEQGIVVFRAVPDMLVEAL